MQEQILSKTKKVRLELDSDMALFLLNIIRQALVSYSLLPKNLKVGNVDRQIYGLNEIVDSLNKQLENL